MPNPVAGQFRQNPTASPGTDGMPDELLSENWDAKLRAQRKNAAEMANARARKRRELEKEAEEVQRQQRAIPQDEPYAELLEQEYGRPIEPPGQKEPEDEGGTMEEGGEEEAQEESVAMQEQKKGAGSVEEAPGEEKERVQYQQRAQQAEASRQQMAMLNARLMEIKRQTDILDLNVKKKLEPLKNKIKQSKRMDGLKNMQRWEKLLAEAIEASVDTVILILIVPALLLLMLLVLILYLCGFPLGPPSPQTLRYQAQYKSQKFLLNEQKNRLARPKNQESKKINQQINQIRTNQLKQNLNT